MNFIIKYSENSQNSRIIKAKRIDSYRDENKPNESQVFLDSLTFSGFAFGQVLEYKTVSYAPLVRWATLYEELGIIEGAQMKGDTLNALSASRGR